ncbi:MAG TPA: hypothetical protein VFZ65_20730 [Planctomycetota bacterium]|nr:hypothetical protein [Planctomycetota bacterium]
MTLPNEDVMDLLADRFVVGFHNIEKASHVGLSHGYKPQQTAVGTTNGAGGRNVQIVVLAADETVLHVLPGFWNAEDLIPELQLALEIHRLYSDETKSPEAKQAMLAVLHRAQVRRYDDAALARSEWQDFDRAAEIQRSRDEARDTVLVDDSGQPVADAPGMLRLKSIPQIVHERLVERSFRKLADFGMETFVDYGRAYYDNNMGLDKGRSFPRAEHANQKREREQEKAEKAAAKLAEKQGQAEKRG